MPEPAHTEQREGPSFEDHSGGHCPDDHLSADHFSERDHYFVGDSSADCFSDDRSLADH